MGFILSSSDIVKKISFRFTPIKWAMGRMTSLTTVLEPIVSAGCSAPPTVSNGGRNYDSWSADYYCNTGYYEYGDDTISCNSCILWCTDYWDNLNFECRIYDCGTPTTVSNGYRSYSGTTYGNDVQYYCNTGYYSSDCGTPSSISNGQRSYSGTTYGQTVTYSCNAGYYSSGSNTITCQSNGHWSTLSYSCTIKDCGTPPTVTDGTRSYSATTYQSTVTYSCNTGYLGSGSTTITCQDSGTWSSMTYVCTIIDCGEPAAIQYATLSTGPTTVWETKTYTCNVGYVATGTPNVDCQLDGTWTSTDYNCPPYDCGQPVDIKDSTIDVPLTTYPNNATYLCDLGHYESDPGNMSIMYCEPPTFELPRSVASWDTTIFRTLNSSTVTYTCNIGYIIDPEEFEDGQVECNHTGQWDEVEFNCIFNYCKNVSKYYKTPSTYPMQSDGMTGQMYVLNDTMYTVECCGVISGWEFKPVLTGFVYMMIWRRNENFIPLPLPKMVAFNTILVSNTSSIVNVTVTDDEKIAVQPFDQIGWYAWEGNPIAYEECDPAIEKNCPQANLFYPGIQNIPEGYEFDWDNNGNILNNRSYAIKYYFTRNTPMQFLEEEYNVSIPDHMITNEPFMTFSIVGVDHAEAATYTLEPLGDTPQTIYFYIDSYFGTVKVSQNLPNSSTYNQYVYNVTAVDGCENYAYTILTVNTYNAPPKFENLPNALEVDDTEIKGNMKLYDIVVNDPTNDSMCCTLQQTFPATLNFELVLESSRATVRTTKNAYFSASFIDSYFVKFCCQDMNYSTSALLQVKVKGEFQEANVPLPGE
ncbi:hypothetical protein FSP39_016693 [Pinctada imbricata]|uniref:Uncharacterized protein n=1 Tax=Pinctada imbricata TaxID=66713 RepID=A0AA88YGI4_PINIB|nr:hypothetical protein FSP39_016693 [Pinctada imbricata]